MTQRTCLTRCADIEGPEVAEGPDGTIDSKMVDMLIDRQAKALQAFVGVKTLVGGSLDAADLIARHLVMGITGAEGWRVAGTCALVSMNRCDEAGILLPIFDDLPKAATPAHRHAIEQLLAAARAADRDVIYFCDMTVAEPLRRTKASVRLHEFVGKTFADCLADPSVFAGIGLSCQGTLRFGERHGWSRVRSDREPLPPVAADDATGEVYVLELR